MIKLLKLLFVAILFIVANCTVQAQTESDHLAQNLNDINSKNHLLKNVETLLSSGDVLKTKPQIKENLLIITDYYKEGIYKKNGFEILYTFDTLNTESAWVDCEQVKNQKYILNINRALPINSSVIIQQFFILLLEKSAFMRGENPCSGDQYRQLIAKQELAKIQ